MVNKIALESVTLDEHRIWVVLRQLYYLITQCEEYNSKRVGITSQQFSVLWVIAFTSELSHRPVIMADITPSLFRNVTSVSKIIDRMEKNGLVKRVRDIPDRRAIRLEMTPKGEKKYKELLLPFKNLIKRLLSIYSKEELKTLVLLLRRLKEKAQEEPYVKEDTTDIALSDPRIIIKILNEAI